MATTVRQNFLLPKKTKQLLDKMVPKGAQSTFVAQTIDARLKAKRAWQILDTPPLLNIKNPLKHAHKIREQLDID